MNVDVEKLHQILSKPGNKQPYSVGLFELDSKPAVCVMFCLPEHVEAVEEFAKTLERKE